MSVDNWYYWYSKCNNITEIPLVMKSSELFKKTEEMQRPIATPSSDPAGPTSPRSGISPEREGREPAKLTQIGPKRASQKMCSRPTPSTLTTHLLCLPCPRRNVTSRNADICSFLLPIWLRFQNFHSST